MDILIKVRVDTNGKYFYFTNLDIKKLGIWELSYWCWFRFSMSKIIAPPVDFVWTSDNRRAALNSNLCFDPTEADSWMRQCTANAKKMRIDVHFFYFSVEGAGPVRVQDYGRDRGTDRRICELGAFRLKQFKSHNSKDFSKITKSEKGKNDLVEPKI